MEFIRKNLANIFTLTNLFLGFVGIISVLYGDIVIGSYMIIFAALFDLLDGFIARILKTTSVLGKQLDSFADLVSFGVLPAIIVHTLILKSHYNWIYFISFVDIPTVSLIPFIITIGATIRLAKFNIDSSQTYSFKGLPSPANALFFASLPLILQNDLYVFHHDTIYLERFVLNPYILIGLSILLAFLMISNIPMFSIKFENLRWQDNYLRYIIIILFIILFIFIYYIAIPLIILIYVILSILMRKKIISSFEKTL